ncbi:MAG TPA: hypothetical protein VGA63_04850 [Geopsychrobacteraceae bacterium]|jgi:hypothetical protein
MIVGFAGKAAVGKTTAARWMEKILDGPVQIIPMAMVLRDEVEAFLRGAGAAEFVPLVHGSQQDKVRVFYIDEQQALGQCGQWPQFVADHREIQDRPRLTAVTVRRILQWWGTEYRRAQDPDYWTKAWARKISQYDPNTTHILIDDVRFINELNSIKEQGGLIVKIERPGFNGANNHASETALDDYRDWDAVLRNDGSLHQFYGKLETLAAELQKDHPG